METLRAFLADGKDAGIAESEADDDEFWGDDDDDFDFEDGDEDVDI